MSWFARIMDLLNIGDNSMRMDTQWKDYHKIEDNLYLGCENTVYECETLKKLKVKRILTLNSNAIHDNAKQSHITYLYIDVNDESGEDILSHLPECLQFIADGLTRKECVYVHCAAGISRSASVVIAHVMRKNGRLFEDARDIVKLKRCVIYPNDGFVKQLRLFGCMGYTLNANNIEFRRHLFSHLINYLKPGDYFVGLKSIDEFESAFNAYFSKLAIASFHPYEKVNLGEEFVCDECGFSLFHEINVIENKSFDRNIDRNSRCKHIFIEPQEWMYKYDRQSGGSKRNTINETMNCRNCKQELGAMYLPFVDHSCSCASHSGLNCLVFKIDTNKVKIKSKNSALDESAEKNVSENN